MIKTIVIGAGVIGASVAYRLAQAGAAVTVLEATRIGGGTSGIDGLSLVSKLNVASVEFQCRIRRPAPSGRVSMTGVRTTRLKPAATGGVNTRNPTVGASGK